MNKIYANYEVYFLPLCPVLGNLTVNVNITTRDLDFTLPWSDLQPTNYLFLNMREARK